MRPLHLTLEGFRSHERRTEISFESRTLIAIVGPTGAGKSSVLDGISYALFAMTPRVQRATRSLICSRSETAHVQLRFEVDAARYEVTRSIRRSGQAVNVLRDLASDEQISGEAAVTQRVQELLGLDFKGFSSAVLLAQNQFSALLEAKPKERVQILKGVFRFDQLDALHAAAKRRAGEFELEVRGVEGALGEIPEDIEAQLKQARADMKTCSTRWTALDKAVPKERLLVERAAALTTERSRLEGELADLQAAVAELPGNDDFDDLAEKTAAIDKPLKAARAALEGAEKERAAAINSFNRLERELGSQRALVEARHDARRYDECGSGLTSRRAELAEAAAAEKSAGAEFLHLEETKGAAAERRRVTKEELRELERAHSAHALRAGLKKGEPCPVCERKLTTVPKAGRLTALTAAEDAAADAERALEEAEQAAASAGNVFVEAQAQVRSLAARVAEEEQELAAIRARLEALVGARDDSLAEIERRLARLDEATEIEQDALKKQEEARNEVARLQDEATAVEAAVRGIAADLIAVAGRVRLDPPDVDAPLVELRKASDVIRSELDERAAAVGRTLSEIASKHADALEEVASLRASLDLDADEPITEALAEAAERKVLAQGRVAELEAKEARRKELAGSLTQLRRRRDVYKLIEDDLRDQNFVKHLLEEKRQLLSDLGSQRLREMTGRYRFDDQGEFNVVDELDGDKERAVDTLSGGETFLASLALALGLADAVARHGGRLQSFFLDEGFGSLDPESLDLAITGIEQIVSPERLIGLVSHVPALADRVEDKIVLDKDADGMSIVRSGSGV